MTTPDLTMDLTTVTLDNGFVCSMEGFRDYVMDTTKAILSVVTMFKSILSSILPEDLAKSLDY